MEDELLEYVRSFGKVLSVDLGFKTSRMKICDKGDLLDWLT